MLKAGATAFCIAAAVMCVAASAQDFEAWEGKTVVHEGQGGTKQLVDGIEFWDRGEPPRKYKIIGYIHDRRHKSGIIGKISMSHLRADVAAVAKQAGGDAVMPVSANTDTVAAVGYGHAVGSGAIGVAHPIQKEESEFVVIKYLSSADDVPEKTKEPAAR
jgi:hypothetical protein